MNTRTLVTGGCGFIGSHIVARLVENGGSVSVLDDLSTGRYKNLPASPLVTFHLGSVLDRTAIKRAAAGTDRVIHLASVVGMRLASTDTTRAYHVSAEGTARVLAATGNTPVVVFSSSAVYPALSGRAHHETDTLSNEAALAYDGGQRGYACGKLRLEHLAIEAGRSGRHVLIIRPFNIIGNAQLSAYGMVVPRFVEDARAGRPLQIYDDGEQTRTFGDIGTFVDCLFRLMEQAHTWLPPHNIFNIGSTETTSVRQLAELVRNATGSAVPLHYVPYVTVFPGRCDVRSRQPDTTRLEAMIGPVEWPSISKIVQQLCSSPDRVHSQRFVQPDRQVVS
jgi:UDP-glucose 4-epimerase